MDDPTIIILEHDFWQVVNRSTYNIFTRVYIYIHPHPHTFI